MVSSGGGGTTNPPTGHDPALRYLDPHTFLACRYARWRYLIAVVRWLTAGALWDICAWYSDEWPRPRRVLAVRIPDRSSGGTKNLLCTLHNMHYTYNEIMLETHRNISFGRLVDLRWMLISSVGMIHATN